MNATRAAVEEGIVIGGGGALLNAAKVLSKLDPANDDQRVGIEIIARALQAPIRQIAENRTEEHTSELQSLMRNSYAVFCLKKRKTSASNRMSIPMKTQRTEGNSMR